MKKIILGLMIVSTVCVASAKGEDMKTEKAIVAGGCFWCTESAYKNIPGVIDAVSGYTGGKTKNPTYDEVSSGRTGHYEAVEVTFDPSVASYEEVLNVFWRDIDPTDEGGQFADRGTQYKTAIFYTSEEQRKIAEESKKKLADSGMFDKPIATQILKADVFYPAEGYHQDYSQTNAAHYKMYRIGSGREGFVKEKWKDTPQICPIPKRKNP